MTAKKRSSGARSKGGRRPGSGGKGGKKYRALPPKESQRISLEQAIDLTQRYRKAAPASEHGGFFWADGLKELLAQADAIAGIRYYHGLDADGRYQLILVAVDADGRDIVRLGGKTGTRAARATSSAVILDKHWPCPPWCDATSPLL